MTKTYHAMSMPEIIAMQDENARLRAALAEREWRPIETAPKDGAAVLLYYPHNDTCIRGIYTEVNDGDWESGYRTWMEWVVDSEHFIQEDPTEAPTHWMPLPVTPINAMREGGEG